MKRKLLSAIIALLLLFQSGIYATAADVLPSDENSVEKVAAISIDIYRSGYNIPNSTSMLSSGVVSDGVITYELKVNALVLNNGSVYPNQTVTWSTTASSSNVKLISSTKTDSYGTSSAIFHVRGVTSFNVKAVCGGATQTESIEVLRDATYSTSFYITYYIVADENDYSGSKTETANGITGLYKPSFLSQVRLNGAGRSSEGKFIKYYNGVYSFTNPTTASGTTPTVNKTIAVDPYYIPMVNRNGWKRGQVDISSTGLRQAEDTGGAIDDYHIDVYTGVGLSTIKENNHYTAVGFRGVNTWGTLSINTSDDLLAFGEVEVPEVQSIWYSDDKTMYGFASSKSSSGKIDVVISTADKNESSVDNEVVLTLSDLALSLEDIKFIDENTVGIEGHVNPSTNVYQIFDLQTGKVLQEYYGYGFTYSGDTLYYVQAPQHFSGIKGYNRILTSDGNMLYESAENVTIASNLEIREGSIVFYEKDNQLNVQTMKSHSTTNIIKTKNNINYYD